MSNNRLSTCLWFDGKAEEAVAFYTSIFKRSKVLKVMRYGEAGREIHGHQPGSVLMITFELDGQEFGALNGGPNFKFTEAISVVVNCDTQEEVDYYWDKLKQGGDDRAQQCGWLKDKFGVSWQVVPRIISELIGDPESERSERAMTAMMGMKKINIAELKRAYDSGRPQRSGATV